MKFTEAMQKAFENPGMEFKSDVEEMMLKTSMKVVNGGLKFNLGNGYTHTFVEQTDYEADWQPLPKEVTWQEAIRALLDGEEVKSVLTEEQADKFNMPLEWSYDFGDTISSIRIKYAKWYILEG